VQHHHWEPTFCAEHLPDALFGEVMDAQDAAPESIAHLCRLADEGDPLGVSKLRDIHLGWTEALARETVVHPKTLGASLAEYLHHVEQIPQHIPVGNDWESFQSVSRAVMELLDGGHSDERFLADAAVTALRRLASSPPRHDPVDSWHATDLLRTSLRCLQVAADKESCGLILSSLDSVLRNQAAPSFDPKSSTQSVQLMAGVLSTAGSTSATLLQELYVQLFERGGILPDVIPAVQALRHHEDIASSAELCSGMYRRVVRLGASFRQWVDGWTTSARQEQVRSETTDGPPESRTLLADFELAQNAFEDRQARALLALADLASLEGDSAVAARHLEAAKELCGYESRVVWDIEAVRIQLRSQVSLLDPAEFSDAPAGLFLHDERCCVLHPSSVPVVCQAMVSLFESIPVQESSSGRDFAVMALAHAVSLSGGSAEMLQCAGTCLGVLRGIYRGEAPALQVAILGALASACRSRVQLLQLGNGDVPALLDQSAKVVEFAKRLVESHEASTTIPSQDIVHRFQRELSRLALALESVAQESVGQGHEMLLLTTASNALGCILALLPEKEAELRSSLLLQRAVLLSRTGDTKGALHTLDTIAVIGSGLSLDALLNKCIAIVSLSEEEQQALGVDLNALVGEVLARGSDSSCTPHLVSTTIDRLFFAGQYPLCISLLLEVVCGAMPCDDLWLSCMDPLARILCCADKVGEAASDAVCRATRQLVPQLMSSPPAWGEVAVLQIVEWVAHRIARAPAPDEALPPLLVECQAVLCAVTDSPQHQFCAMIVNVLGQAVEVALGRLEDSLFTPSSAALMRQWKSIDDVLQEWQEQNPRLFDCAAMFAAKLVMTHQTLLHPSKGKLQQETGDASWSDESKRELLLVAFSLSRVLPLLYSLARDPDPASCARTVPSLLAVVTTMGIEGASDPCIGYGRILWVASTLLDAVQGGNRLRQLRWRLLSEASEQLSQIVPLPVEDLAIVCYQCLRLFQHDSAECDKVRERVCSLYASEPSKFPGSLVEAFAVMFYNSAMDAMSMGVAPRAVTLLRSALSLSTSETILVMAPAIREMLASLERTILHSNRRVSFSLESSAKKRERDEAATPEGNSRKRVCTDQ
jgi:hypothetical protein